MRRSFPVTLALTVSLAVWLTAAGRVLAQAPAAQGAAPAAQKKPAAESPQPVAGAAQPAAASPANANPFPGDTSSVPVLPSRNTPEFSPGMDQGADSAGIPLPGEDLDPVRSPDDPAPEVSGGQGQSWSSSLSGLDKLLPQPDGGLPSKKRRDRSLEESAHQETASEDISVGSYYLDTKDWKGALSRFESALVLDPDNPDVYWGLAESQRHLGDFADARANYLKVVEYDPGSHHSKEARKALDDPAIANARQAAPAPAAEAQQ